MTKTLKKNTKTPGALELLKGLGLNETTYNELLGQLDMMDNDDERDVLLSKKEIDKNNYPAAWSYLIGKEDVEDSVLVDVGNQLLNFSRKLVNEDISRIGEAEGQIFRAITVYAKIKDSKLKKTSFINAGKKLEGWNKLSFAVMCYGDGDNQEGIIQIVDSEINRLKKIKFDMFHEVSSIINLVDYIRDKKRYEQKIRTILGIVLDKKEADFESVSDCLSAFKNKTHSIILTDGEKNKIMQKAWEKKAYREMLNLPS